MTKKEKEKLMQVFIAVQSIKSSASAISMECRDYSRLAATYADSILRKCDEINKLL